MPKATLPRARFGCVSDRANAHTESWAWRLRTWPPFAAFLAAAVLIATVFPHRAVRPAIANSDRCNGSQAIMYWRAPRSRGLVSTATAIGCPQHVAISLGHACESPNPPSTRYHTSENRRQPHAQRALRDADNALGTSLVYRVKADPVYQETLFTACFSAGRCCRLLYPLVSGKIIYRMSKGGRT
jgi:hypothetical protein